MSDDCNDRPMSAAAMPPTVDKKEPILDVEVDKKERKEVEVDETSDGSPMSAAAMSPSADKKETILDFEGDTKESEEVEVDETSDDRPTPAAAMPPTADEKEPILDFEVAAVPQRKANGAIMCLAVDCPKVAQSHSEGFCRMHHNRVLIYTGRCDSWDCLCGEKVASFQVRCSRCRQRRGGKHGRTPSAGKRTKKARTSASPDFEAGDDGAVPTRASCAAEVWRSDDCDGTAPVSLAGTVDADADGMQGAPVGMDVKSTRKRGRLVDMTSADAENTDGTPIVMDVDSTQTSGATVEDVADGESGGESNLEELDATAEVISPCLALGDGWTEKLVPRKTSKNGKSSKVRRDRHYVSPEGATFRSLDAALRHMGTAEGARDADRGHGGTNGAKARRSLRGARHAQSSLPHSDPPERQEARRRGTRPHAPRARNPDGSAGAATGAAPRAGRRRRGRNARETEARPRGPRAKPVADAKAGISPSAALLRANAGIARTLERAYYECRVDPYRGLGVRGDRAGRGDATDDVVAREKANGADDAREAEEGTSDAAVVDEPRQSARRTWKEQDEDKLVEMGYSRDRAVRALGRCRELPKALDCLISAEVNNDGDCNSGGDSLNSNVDDGKGGNVSRRTEGSSSRLDVSSEDGTADISGTEDSSVASETLGGVVIPTESPWLSCQSILWDHCSNCSLVKGTQACVDREFHKHDVITLDSDDDDKNFNVRLVQSKCPTVDEWTLRQWDEHAKQSKKKRGKGAKRRKKSNDGDNSSEAEAKLIAGKRGAGSEAAYPCDFNPVRYQCLSVHQCRACSHPLPRFEIVLPGVAWGRHRRVPPVRRACQTRHLFAIGRWQQVQQQSRQQRSQRQGEHRGPDKRGAGGAPRRRRRQRR